MYNRNRSVSAELTPPKTTRNTRNHLRACITAAIVAAVSSVPLQPVAAATATGTMAVTANILDNCTLTVAPMPFGNYVNSTANTMTATVTANCTLGGLATLSANKGTNGASIAARSMLNPAGPGTMLPYQLYVDTNRTTVWGDGTGGSQVIAVTGTGAAVAYTIYGNLPTSSVVYPGAYSDNVTVTLTY